MHPKSPSFTIGGTMLNESDDLVILGVTFDSRWLLRSIFALVPEQLLNGLVSWGSPGKYSMIDCFLVDAFGVLFCPFWSLFFRWWSAADTYLKLVDHVVSGASFLTRGVVECDLAHRRSVAVLSMLLKIRCNPMHPLYGARPVPYVPTRVTRSTGYTQHIGTLMHLLAEPHDICWENCLHFVYAPSCVSVFYAPNCINALPID